MLRNLYTLHRQFQKELRLMRLPQRSYGQKVSPSSNVKAVLSTKEPANADAEISNEPIEFFGSKAATWRAKETRSGGADEMLWYQPYVISASLAIFMLYFMVFREENDIDQKLGGSLYDHVNGLEELQLTLAYKYNKDNGLDTKDLEQRLTVLGVDVKLLEAQILTTQQ